MSAALLRKVARALAGELDSGWRLAKGPVLVRPQDAPWTDVLELRSVSGAGVVVGGSVGVHSTALEEAFAHLMAREPRPEHTVLVGPELGALTGHRSELAVADDPAKVADVARRLAGLLAGRLDPLLAGLRSADGVLAEIARTEPHVGQAGRVLRAVLLARRGDVAAGHDEIDTVVRESAPGGARERAYREVLARYDDWAARL